MGRIYSLNLYQLFKAKRLRNQRKGGNRWNATKTNAKIAPDGLNLSPHGWRHVFAVEGIAIPGEHLPPDQTHAKLLYYYEITQKSSYGL
jgi:integrase